MGNSSYAQNQMNIWHFGNGAGLDFSGGAPVSISGGQTNQNEGTAILSDSLGNLLFYTDGMTVWNANHAFMQNGTGLLGHNSSTMSGLIVPNPKRDSIYYVFTVGVTTPDLRFSEINMNLAGGIRSYCAQVIREWNISGMQEALIRNLLLMAPEFTGWVFLICPAARQLTRSSYNAALLNILCLMPFLPMATV